MKTKTPSTQTKEYRQRHSQLRKIYLEGYNEQKQLLGEPTIKEIQNTTWYKFITWARDGLAANDIYDPRMEAYIYVLGKIHADGLPITRRNVCTIEAAAIYEFYNKEHRYEIYTPKYFKEDLLSNWLGLQSTVSPPTVYSWFYKQKMKFNEDATYPGWLFARVAYLCFCNPKVVLEKREIDSDFYRAMTQT